MSYYRNQRVADDERPGQQPLPSDTAIPVPALLSLLDSYPFWTDEQQVLGTRKRRTYVPEPGPLCTVTGGPRPTRIQGIPDMAV